VPAAQPAGTLVTLRARAKHSVTSSWWCGAWRRRPSKAPVCATWKASHAASASASVACSTHVNASQGSDGGGASGGGADGGEAGE